jgi:hypothetical protein
MTISKDIHKRIEICSKRTNIQQQKSSIILYKMQQSKPNHRTDLNIDIQQRNLIKS